MASDDLGRAMADSVQRAWTAILMRREALTVAALAAGVPLDALSWEVRDEWRSTRWDLVSEGGGWHGGVTFTADDEVVSVGTADGPPEGVRDGER
jgi:hypothetical protein